MTQADNTIRNRVAVILVHVFFAGKCGDFCLTVTIVSNSLGDRFSLIQKNRSYVHHCPTQRRRGIKLLFDGDKGNFQVIQCFNFVVNLINPNTVANFKGQGPY